MGGILHGANGKGTDHDFHGNTLRHHIYQASALLDYNAYPHLVLVSEGFPQCMNIVHGQLRHVQGIDSLFRGKTGVSRLSQEMHGLADESIALGVQDTAFSRLHLHHMALKNHIRIVQATAVHKLLFSSQIVDGSLTHEAVSVLIIHTFLCWYGYKVSGAPQVLHDA